MNLTINLNIFYKYNRTYGFHNSFIEHVYLLLPHVLRWKIRYIFLTMLHDDKTMLHVLSSKRINIPSWNTVLLEDQTRGKLLE